MVGSGASIFTVTLNMKQALKRRNPDMETVAVDYRDTQSRKAENKRCLSSYEML
jgi:hypothetical protein